MNRNSILRLAVIAALAQAGVAQAQTTTVEEIVVTGTRVADRSATQTAVPVDIVTAEALSSVGITELNQALSVVLPSFNFPRPGLADGTDTVRPATLRGLAPDQTLVLVNSKRRHRAALVNVNGTIGRGSSAVDLNTIPNAAVRSIQVLRDGASAQYGSDAIAGVINVILREDRDGGGANVSYGWRDSSYKIPVGAAPAGANYAAPAEISRSRSDGETITVSGWKGFGFGDTGFVVVAAEYKDQERTERGGLDIRRQYFLLPDGSFDPREQTFNRFSAWFGEPEVEQLTLFVNAGTELQNGASVYGWASYQDRDAVSAGFYRPANDARNVVEIYPDGFLPLIAPEVTDLSAAIGTTWMAGVWELDTSLVYGKNKMSFEIINTLNRSFGPASQTEFDAGGYDADQLVLNLSGVRSIEVAAFDSPLNIAMGIEARREGYSISAGEDASWQNGGVLLNGNPTASGAQVFPGFRPSNEISESRTAVGAYIDLEANITSQLLGSVAARAENYSDFGSTVTGKLSLRYDFTDAFALRGSVQNGFRAPSLQQQYFTGTATNFIGGVPFDVSTFPVDDPIARALGAVDLEAEKSINASLGAVMNFGAVTLTVDAYRIDIDDRIVLSENLTQPNVRAFLEAQGFIGSGGGRFFLNGVDTKTTGVDIVANMPLSIGNGGRLDFTLLGNFNSTTVKRVPVTQQLAALTPSPVLFDRNNVLTFEEGTPSSKLGASVNWTQDRFGATARATRYGSVLSPAPSPGNNPANDVTLGAKTLLDLEFRFDATDNIRLIVGADNVFDTYPDANPINLNGTGATAFSNYSPFGRSGRFVYGRLALDF
jgi:iron complex outermembrane receptor protein